MYSKALQAVTDHANSIAQLGLDVSKLKNILADQIQLAKKPNHSFSDVILPIKDPHLIDECKKRCTQLNLKWVIQDSTYVTETIIHKHKERDRHPVVAERMRQLQLRAQKRQ